MDKKEEIKILAKLHGFRTDVKCYDHIGQEFEGITKCLEYKHNGGGLWKEFVDYIIIDMDVLMKSDDPQEVMMLENDVRERAFRKYVKEHT